MMEEPLWSVNSHEDVLRTHPHTTSSFDRKNLLLDSYTTTANVRNPPPKDTLEDNSNSNNYNASSNKEDPNKTLGILFLLMILIGSANKIFSKLQTVPMYNYPNFLNLLTTFMYVPLCFSYIYPASKIKRRGSTEPIISQEQMNMSKWPFFVMGILDCMSSLMGTFASVYLPGPLLVLLPQASIPISMVLSRQLLGERYVGFQYAGALVVVMGIFFVLSPEVSSSSAATFECVALDEEEYCLTCKDEVVQEACLAHVDSTTGSSLCDWTSNASGEDEQQNTSTLIWSAVLIFACIPGTLSSIYKEKALGETQLDPVFLNGWIAIFQFLFSIVLAVPAGLATEPPVQPIDLPSNLLAGFKCYIGIGTVDTGCHPDDHCATEAPIFVNIYLALNIVYNLLMVLMLKYGSTSILYLAMTVMVPIGNLAFALPFMPEPSKLHFTDIIGLMVIMTGLSLYRFGDRVMSFLCISRPRQNELSSVITSDDTLNQCLINHNHDRA